ncbi:hypothetical protein ABPG72_008167 [Tetrahymena utriculariae]
MDTQNSISLHSTSIGISDYSDQKDNLISGLLSSPSSNVDLSICKKISNYTVAVDLDTKNTFSKLNNRNSNKARKLFNKNKKIEKLDVNYQPSNIKKKANPQILESKFMQKLSSEKQQHEKPDTNMASQKKLTQKQRIQQNSLPTYNPNLQVSFQNSKQLQQQKNGSKNSIKFPVGNQIGKQAKQSSLAEIKTIILPDTQKRNSAQKSNLKLKSNTKVKSSTQPNKNRFKQIISLQKKLQKTMEDGFSTLTKILYDISITLKQGFKDMLECHQQNINKHNLILRCFLMNEKNDSLRQEIINGINESYIIHRY